jgi:hypothetical protein
MIGSTSLLMSRFAEYVEYVPFEARWTGGMSGKIALQFFNYFDDLTEAAAMLGYVKLYLFWGIVCWGQNSRCGETILPQ